MHKPWCMCSHERVFGIGKDAKNIAVLLASVDALENKWSRRKLVKILVETFLFFIILCEDIQKKV